MEGFLQFPCLQGMDRHARMDIANHTRKVRKPFHVFVSKGLTSLTYVETFRHLHWRKKDLKRILSS